MKTALVHDWLLTIGGAEKTLEAIYQIYPGSIFTLLADKKTLGSSPLKQAPIYTSFLQKFPLVKKWYRYYLPFYPLAIEKFDLRNYDLVISSSHAVAKGVLPMMTNYIFVIVIPPCVMPGTYIINIWSYWNLKV